MLVCTGKVSVIDPSRHRVVLLLLMKLMTHFTINSGTNLYLMLCNSPAGATWSKAPVMSSDSSVATTFLFCHNVLVCCTRMSKAVSLDLLGHSPMCQAG
jgi:hypothetical protein